MTELARFLRDVLLHPTLRTQAAYDLRAATAGYALLPEELSLIETADPRLLDAIGQAVRDEHAPERPTAVQRLKAPDPAVFLDPAALWLRLAPFQAADGSVRYAVGIVGEHSDTPPAAPVLPGQALPIIDLTVMVQPTLQHGQVRFASSLLPRDRHLPPPRTAQAHRCHTDPEVQRAVDRTRASGDFYAGTLEVIDALLLPGGRPPSSTHPTPTSAADVTIIGTGMVFPDHITVEGIAAVERAHEVLVVDTGIATLKWMRARCPQVTPLVQTAYVEGDTRLHTYHHFVASTIAAALHHPPVVFAMSGHPLVSAYAPFLLADTARAFGLTVACQPGISSFASILCALEVDPLLTGLQLHEATDLLLQRRPLQADLPVLIFQVGTVGTLLHSDRKRSNDAFVPLRDHLLRFFPPEHRITALHTSPHPMVADSRIEVSLKELCSIGPDLHAGFSLWVPAASDRALADAALAAGLSDVDVLHDQLQG